MGLPVREIIITSLAVGTAIQAVNPFPTPGIPGFLRDRIATRARMPSSRMTDPYDARLKECVHTIDMQLLYRLGF